MNIKDAIEAKYRDSVPKDAIVEVFGRYLEEENQNSRIPRE
jgi:hypothetical protein